MAQFYDALRDEDQTFIEAQRMFFVASAPDTGRVNLSPKGMDSFRVLGPNRVAYLDLTGSANETSAHLRQNGRITVMFCAFDGPPNIVRLYGRGRVVTPTDQDWAEYGPLFPEMAGTRQIIVIDVDLVQSACGMSVPYYDFKGQRDTLVKHWEKQGEANVRKYWKTRNAVSIDGLETVPLDTGPEEGGE